MGINYKNFTKRELEVWRLVALGYDNLYISSILFVVPNTVKAHIHNIYNKLPNKLFYNKIERVVLANLYWSYIDKQMKDDLRINDAM